MLCGLWTAAIHTNIPAHGAGGVQWAFVVFGDSDDEYETLQNRCTPCCMGLAPGPSTVSHVPGLCAACLGCYREKTMCVFLPMMNSSLQLCLRYADADLFSSFTARISVGRVLYHGIDRSLSHHFATDRPYDFLCS
jgi:hypothetical protein